MAALLRVCLDNTLFLPSFPISEMSDLELEKAAMAPRRWIELCGSFEKQHLKDPGAMLRPRATRIIDDSLTIEIDFFTTRRDVFVVPGGRYLVSFSGKGIVVLDLGYTSSADCKIIASTGEAGPNNLNVKCLVQVQATPDGTGLVIFRSYS